MYARGVFLVFVYSFFFVLASQSSLCVFWWVGAMLLLMSGEVLSITCQSTQRRLPSIGCVKLSSLYVRQWPTRFGKSTSQRANDFYRICAIGPQWRTARPCCEKERNKNWSRLDKVRTHTKKNNVQKKKQARPLSSQRGAVKISILVNHRAFLSLRARPGQ